MSTSSDLPLRSLLVFLLAMAVLSLEVALTRVFSFIMYHHFTYLVISIAMLGFGAAGAYLATRKQKPGSSNGHEFLNKMAGLFALSTIATIIFIPRIHFYPLDILINKDYSNMLSLFIIIILTASPFFFAGVCIAYIISTAARNINRVYFADLTGAAAGCLLVLILINYTGAIAACFVSAAIALLVVLITSARRRGLYFAALILVAASAFGIYKKNPLPLYVPRYKQMFGKEHLVESIKWHVTTRLDVTRPVDVYYSFGGALSRKYDGPPQKAIVIYQDATALTGILQPTPTPAETPSLAYYLQGAPYQIKPKADSLVIGCGGGPDIMIALYNKANKVVGVDINPKMIELLHENTEFTNGVFKRDDVELVALEGRHFLSRDNRKFDVIQLSGVDTSAALASGAYALSENFIYTIEAFDQYLEHLKPDGIVNFSRPPGWQTMKIINMWLETLEQKGVPEPHKHIMVLNGNGQHKIKVGDSWIVEEGPWSQTLVKKSPFTKKETETLANWTEQLGFEVVYDPYKMQENENTQLILAKQPQRQQFIDQYGRNIKACTDDSPFYFQFYRWENIIPTNWFGKNSVRPPTALIILLGSLAIVTVLSGIFIIYPLHRNSPAAKSGGRAGIFVYFAALGLGFIVVEIALLQKLTVFLGGPAYSMSITLFTILLTSGIGSFLSRNWSSRPFRLLAIVIPLIAVGIIGEIYLLDYAIPRLMYLSHTLRAVAAVVIVAPVGLLMGMPFPTGLRYVNSFRPELNPWAWGINACATVMGSIICVMISSLAGFNLVLLLGAAVYLIGLLVFVVSQSKSVTTL
ncbi:MAG: methyltransferase domain-containing protein [Sedimentisphaerales bacterium]|nr:methyltransferase domain-containing protein [Sedimentisphaerales bacterium]